jgi:TonB family protein
MTAIEKRFRRNFILACIVHGALIVGIVIFEGVISNARSSVPSPVQLITPADILGDLPKGPGVGRGNYAPAPPPPAPESAPESGQNEAPLAADEQPGPKAKPAQAPTPAVHDPNDILIPKKPVKPTPKKPVVADKSTAKTATTTPTKATSTASAKTTAKSAAKGTSTGKTVSADSIRQHFASALASADGGSPGGDNRTPGGGTGESKYGRLGSPDGAADGIAGGIGKGSPFWSYYLMVHDRMYEAWEQPGEAVSFDKKLVATILLRVARDGRIDGVRLEHSSGNKLMDDSAVAAAHSVPRLDPLPEGLGGDTAEITVNFRLEG